MHELQIRAARVLLRETRKQEQKLSYSSKAYVLNEIRKLELCLKTCDLNEQQLNRLLKEILSLAENVNFLLKSEAFLAPERVPKISQDVLSAS